MTIYEKKKSLEDFGPYETSDYFYTLDFTLQNLDAIDKSNHVIFFFEEGIITDYKTGKSVKLSDDFWKEYESYCKCYVID